MLDLLHRASVFRYMPDKTSWQLGQLDALRGIAVCGVLLVHTAYLTSQLRLPLPPVLDAVVFAGQRGVQLFYLVSAFTLALSHDRRKAERRPLWNFFLRRFFRIAPMFYVAMVLTRRFAPEYSGNQTAHLLAATFTNGLHPVFIGLGAAGGWSIADEAIFYALLPLLLLWIKSVRSAALALLIGSALSRVAVLQLTQIYPAFATYWSFDSMIAELPVFLSGLLVFQVWKELGFGAGRYAFLSPYLLCGSVLSLVLLLPFRYDQLLLQSFLLAVLLLAMLLRPWRFLVNRVTIFLGKVSFSVYLLHFYVYFWLERRRFHLFHTTHASLVALLTLATGAAIVIPLATLTWLYIEEPGIALGRRLIAWLELREPPASVPPLTSAADIPDAQF